MWIVKYSDSLSVPRESESIGFRAVKSAFFTSSSSDSGVKTLDFLRELFDFG